jgi:hypothetical protein
MTLLHNVSKPEAAGVVAILHTFIRQVPYSNLDRYTDI